MAQEYDMQEYWRQFDDNSRWVGFAGNLEIIDKNIADGDDDVITMLDYIVARSAYDVLDDTEEEKSQNHTEKKITPDEKIEVANFHTLTVTETKKQNLKDSETIVEDNLMHTFYELKKTVN